METPSEFDIARLAALKEYARLELELCLLLRNLLGVDSDAAAAIFYQISNTRSRYAIMGRLIDLNREVKWQSWKKIEAWLGPCDTARNHLVHWFESHVHVMEAEKDDAGELVGFKNKGQMSELRTPTRRWQRSPDDKIYRTEDIYDARDSFRVMVHIVNRFHLTVEGFEGWPWRDIFQQPAGCQTPVEFLQRLNALGHEVRLPPYDR